MKKRILNDKDADRLEELDNKAFAYFASEQNKDLTPAEHRERNNLRKKVFRTIDDEFVELAKMFQRINKKAAKKVKARKKIKK